MCGERMRSASTARAVSAELWITMRSSGVLRRCLAHNGVVIVRVGIRRRWIARGKRTFDRLIKSGFADLTLLLRGVLMLHLVWCHGVAFDQALLSDL